MSLYKTCPACDGYGWHEEWIDVPIYDRQGVLKSVETELSRWRCDKCAGRGEVNVFIEMVKDALDR